MVKVRNSFKRNREEFFPDIDPEDFDWYQQHVMEGSSRVRVLVIAEIGHLLNYETFLADEDAQCRAGCPFPLKSRGAFTSNLRSPKVLDAIDAEIRFLRYLADYDSKKDVLQWDSDAMRAYIKRGESWYNARKTRRVSYEDPNSPKGRRIIEAWSKERISAKKRSYSMVLASPTRIFVSTKLRAPTWELSAKVIPPGLKGDTKSRYRLFQVCCGDRTFDSVSNGFGFIHHPNSASGGRTGLEATRGPIPFDYFLRNRSTRARHCINGIGPDIPDDINLYFGDGPVVDFEDVNYGRGRFTEKRRHAIGRRIAEWSFGPALDQLLRGDGSGTEPSVFAKAWAERIHVMARVWRDEQNSRARMRIRLHTEDPRELIPLSEAKFLEPFADAPLPPLDVFEEGRAS